MTSRIIWIVVGAIVTVVAMILFSKAVESKEEKPEEKGN